MLAFLSFILVILGCVNWLLIGLLQYDFVAGLFGYQGSIFSRLIYIIIGAASVFLVIKAFTDKGKINIVNFKFKLKKQKNKKEEVSKNEIKPEYNVEAAKEFHSLNEEKKVSGKDYSESDAFNQNNEQDEREKPQKNNIFNELQ